MGSNGYLFDRGQQKQLAHQDVEQVVELPLVQLRRRQQLLVAADILDLKPLRWEQLRQDAQRAFNRWLAPLICSGGHVEIGVSRSLVRTPPLGFVERQAKVGQVDVIVLVEQNVDWLQIAMPTLMGVDVRESVGDLDREQHGLLHRERAGFQPMAEGQAIDVLLDDVGRHGLFFQRDHLHHIRMIEIQHALGRSRDRGPNAS